MDYNSEKVPKAKLPRRRKKAAIRAQGRDWYHATIRFFYISRQNPLIAEKRCTFWKHDSMRTVGKIQNNKIFCVREPMYYW